MLARALPAVLLWCLGCAARLEHAARRAQGLSCSELDTEESCSHIDTHANGAAIVQWLSLAEQVIPELHKPAGGWPENLVVTYASGYNWKILKPLLVSFLANVQDAALVLLTDKAPPDLPPTVLHRVIVQTHALPSFVSNPEQLPGPVLLRFYVIAAFLERSGHQGRVFVPDSRDVFIQKDIFRELPKENILLFPRESGGYRLRGPFSRNAEWIKQCYGEATLRALGGHYVLNSGTFFGGSPRMLQYIRLMLEELGHRWHCRRLHGSDQAIHNYLVYTGKLIGTGIEFEIAEMETGRFASCAWVHPGLLNFVNVTAERAELQNRMGEPFVSVHLWPGEDSPFARRVVLPFVREYERQVLAGS